MLRYQYLDFQLIEKIFPVFGKWVRDIFRIRHSEHNLRKRYALKIGFHSLPVFLTFNRTVDTCCKIEDCKVWWDAACMHWKSAIIIVFVFWEVRWPTLTFFHNSFHQGSGLMKKLILYSERFYAIRIRAFICAFLETFLACISWIWIKVQFRVTAVFW